MHFNFFTFLSLIHITSFVFAQNTLVLQPDATEGKDAMIGHTPSINFGNSPDLICNTWTCSGQLCVWRSLIEFDLTPIPTGAEIVDAKLYLFARTNTTQSGGNPTTGSNNKGWLRRLVEPWDEMSVTWNNQPSNTSVNQIEIPESTSNTQDYIIDVKQLVIDMLQDGNYGFLLMQQDEINFYKSLCFSSSDDPNSNRHPKLVITFKVSHTSNTALSEVSFIKAFHNYYSEKLIIETGNTSYESLNIKVYDLLGRIFIDTKSTNNRTEIDTSHLLAGAYLVRCDANNASYITKFIRQ